MAKVFTILCLIAIFSAPGRMSAQVERGTLVGSVCDQSGAAVPDAKVTTTSAETNTSTATKTDNDGHHVITPLKIGHYSAGVQAPGFESEDRSNTTLDAQDRLVVDFSLAVGSVSENVQVSTEAPYYRRTPLLPDK